MAFELPIIAFRHAPWGGSSGLADLVRLGEDWTGAIFQWVFADAAGGTAKFTLANAAAGSQGVSATYDAEYPHPTSGASVLATILRPQIDESTLEGLTSPTVPSDDIVLYHTFYVTPSGGLKRVFCYGPATIKQGAPG